MSIRSKMVLAFSAFAISASAREVTALSVDVAAETATVSFANGVVGETNAVYLAWSDDGVDKGGDIASWPHVLRLGLVADETESLSLELPVAARAVRLYAARAFLAETQTPYGYLVDGVSSKGSSAYINTGFFPTISKTSIFVECKYTSVPTATAYIFGTYYKSNCAFLAYVNASGYWVYAAAKSTSSALKTTDFPATTERTTISLISTNKVVSSSTTSYFSVTTPSGTSTASTTADSALTTSKPLYLFASDSSGTAKYFSSATIYSCVITNSGACVRDYVPAIRYDVAGFYDRANGNFVASAGTTALVAGTNVNYFVTPGDVVLTASSGSLWVNEDLASFRTDVPFVETASLASLSGGSKIGAAPLYLTGENNWGGSFSVGEGTLVADFGQGLALTDNLVFNGGTYGLLSGDVFNWTIGTGGGETSVGEGVQTYGFSACGRPFSIVAGGDASTPLELGTASSTGFDAGLSAWTFFMLNDAYATDTVTLKNGIVGRNADGSVPVLRVRTDSASAVIEGGISNVTMQKWGAGTLHLKGATNSFSVLYPRQGKLIISPPDGEDKCRLSLSYLSNTTNTLSEMVVSNAVIVQKPTAVTTNMWYGNTKVSLVGCTMTSSSDWYPGNGSTVPDGNGVLLLDNSSLTISKTFNPGYYSSGKYCKGEIIVTNNSTLSLYTLYGRYGSVKQYSGTVTVSYASAGGTRISSAKNGSFTYYLYGGKLDLTSTNSKATFALGFYNGGYASTGNMYIYDGGEFIARGAYGHLGRYSKDKGNLYVRGGKMTMTREAAVLYVGYTGNGICEVSEGGVLDISKGNVCVAVNSSTTNRTGRLSILSSGTVKARRIYSSCTNDTATLVLDGGNVVANASANASFMHGFTSASVGTGGVSIATGGQNLTVAQSFAALADQDAPTASSAAEAAAMPAFTKTGAGRLSLTGTNGWLCATCVAGGTLAVAEKSLPATTLRLEGGVIDLGGFTHTVTNLVGSGTVSNGTLVVAGTVWPGVDGVGDIVFTSDATLCATNFAYSVDAGTGTCAGVVAHGPIDVSGARISIDNLAAARPEGIALVKGAPVSGRPVSAEGLHLFTTSRAVRYRVPCIMLEIR